MIHLKWLIFTRRTFPAGLLFALCIPGLVAGLAPGPAFASSSPETTEVTIVVNQFGRVGETQFYRDVKEPTNPARSEITFPLQVTVTETATGAPITSAAANLAFLIEPSDPVFVTWTETAPGVYDGIVNISDLLLYINYTLTVIATGDYSGASAPQDFWIVGRGDVTGDRVVNTFDRAAIVKHWTMVPVGPLGYHPNYDVNRDGQVDLRDRGEVSDYWSVCPGEQGEEIILERDFEQLIGGIIALLLGGIATIFWKRISEAMLLSLKTFWGKLGIGKDRDSTWDKWVAKILVLVLGIGFLVGGICLLCQSFI